MEEEQQCPVMSTRSAESCQAMFTTPEAVSFLQDQWGVQRVQERVDDASLRKGLLEEVIRLVHSKVPFQSITLMAVPPAERKRPDMTTIKEECMAGVGGLCYSINVFVWGLLKPLGFSVHLCIADVGPKTETHLVILLNDLEKQGDLHLVDCGAGSPTFEPIFLDFETESPIFVHSFLEYKFIRHEGKVLRMHGKGDTTRIIDSSLDSSEGRWSEFYSFLPRPSDRLSDFDATYDKLFTIPGTFHHTPMAQAFPDQRSVLMVKNRLTVEKEDGEMDSTVLDGDEAIVDSYRRYVPSLREDTVRRALYQWHNTTKQ